MKGTAARQDCLGWVQRSGTPQYDTPGNVDWFGYAAPILQFLEIPPVPLFQLWERDGGAHGLEVLPGCWAPNAKNCGYALVPIAILPSSPAHRPIELREGG